MKRFSFCSIFFFAFYCSAFAGKITGTVTDINDNKALAFASISVKGTTKGTNANILGVYYINLAPGNYTLVCEYVGYKKTEKSITVTDAEMVVNFSLDLQEKDLEVVVVSTKSDKAYEIIREAIAKRKEHNGEMDKFTCQVYTKGNLKVRSYPNKILGQKINFGDADTSKQKMIYLSETISNYSVDKPGKEKTEVISSKVSGRPNDYGLSAPNFFSFYEENVFIGGQTNSLNQRGFVSPLADNAISYYRFRFKGTFIEDGILINRIQVFPRRKYEPLFTGFINIVENEWRIHSLELTLTKESQIELLDTLKIQQLYTQGADNRWMIKNQVLYPAVKIVGVDAYGSFLNVYSDFNFTPVFAKKDFTSTLLKVTDSANKKSLGYWEAARPVPLMVDEIHDYKMKDSLDIAKKDKKYIDSMDKEMSKISVFNTLFTGIRFVTTPKRISLQFQPLPEIVSFNIVEGVVINTGFDWSKKLDENPYSKRRITLSPNFRYGFLNKHFNAHLTTRYNFGTKYQSSAMLSGGKRIFQFNNKINIGPRRNTLATLLSQKNLMLFYEAWYLRGSYSRGIGNGFNWTVAFQYQDRMPLENASDYTWRKKNDRQFTPNYPVELMNENIKRHQILTFLYKLSWQPKSKYIELPEGKFNLGSKYPVFDLQVETAFNGLLGTDGDFSKWKLSVKDDWNFRLQGKFSYQIGAGGFIKTNNVQVPDYNHFNGNISHFASDYLNSYQVLPMYQFSNIEKLYAFGHIEHHFNGFITNKIPIIKKWNWHLVAAANGFYHKNANYYELSAGFENIHIGKIIRGLRIDFVQSFLNGNSSMGNFRIGIGRNNAKLRDDYP
jgi:Family of unknown function (DUF5686)/CarboxypepD_reg-like domain